MWYLLRSRIGPSVLPLRNCTSTGSFDCFSSAGVPSATIFPRCNIAIRVAIRNALSIRWVTIMDVTFDLSVRLMRRPGGLRGCVASSARARCLHRAGSASARRLKGRPPPERRRELVRRRNRILFVITRLSAFPSALHHHHHRNERKVCRCPSPPSSSPRAISSQSPRSIA